MAVRPTKPLYKIAVVGEEGVGRRSIISKYTNDDTPFGDSKLKKKIVELDSDTIEIEISYEDIHEQILDLTGWGTGIMLVYDVTNNKSFDSIKNRLLHNRSARKRLLVGNKVDLESQRVVPKEIGEQLAQDRNMLFVETSAITGSNIDKAFETIIRDIKKYHMDHAIAIGFGIGYAIGAAITILIGIAIAIAAGNEAGIILIGIGIGGIIGFLIGFYGFRAILRARARRARIEPIEPKKLPLPEIEEEEPELPELILPPSSFFRHDEHKTSFDTDNTNENTETSSKNIVLAERSVSFTSDRNNTFILQQCGLSLFFPQEVITTPVDSAAAVSYNVTTKGLWAGQFVFPEGTQLISSVTSVSLNAPFPLNKPVTVQLMHCASITDQSQSNYLSFVVSHSVQPPFEFELLPGGDFHAGSKYGTIQLKEFSLIAIVLVVSASAAIAAAIGYRFSQVPLLRCQGMIYYKRESENMKMNFAVLNDLPHNDAIIKFKNESYKKFGEEEWNFPFQMRKDSQLKLIFPQEPNGWTVLPLRKPPTIHERDVCAYTEFNTSSDLPPYISVILRATTTAAEWLVYEITVNGIHIDDKENFAIVVHKSRKECGRDMEENAPHAV